MFAKEMLKAHTAEALITQMKRLMSLHLTFEVTHTWHSLTEGEVNFHNSLLSLRIYMLQRHCRKPMTWQTKLCRNSGEGKTLVPHSHSPKHRHASVCVTVIYSMKEMRQTVSSNALHFR